MITAIIKIQGCTTKPGRRAFVSKNSNEHGIAAGVIRFYKVTGRNWTAIRNAVASYDSTGRRTMGFSNVGPTTVVSFNVTEGKSTESSVIPFPLGTTAAQFTNQ